MIYDNIMDYHADSLISYDTSIEVVPDPDIELAVLRSEEEGSPYNIRGLLAFYDSFSDGTLSIKVVNTNDLDIELISIHDEKNKSQYQISGISLQPTGDDVEYITIEIDNVDNDFAGDIGDMYIDYMYDDGNVWTAEIIPFTMLDYDMYDSTDIRIKII